MAVIEALCEALLRVGVVRALVGACGKEAPAELREQAPPISPLYLDYISPISPLYLHYISPISPLYLPYTSPSCTSRRLTRTRTPYPNPIP